MTTPSSNVRRLGNAFWHASRIDDVMLATSLPCNHTSIALAQPTQQQQCRAPRQDPCTYNWRWAFCLGC